LALQDARAGLHFGADLASWLNQGLDFHILTFGFYIDLADGGSRNQETPLDGFLNRRNVLTCDLRWRDLDFTLHHSGLGWFFNQAKNFARGRINAAHF
jgi:hypothetical protein